MDCVEVVKLLEMSSIRDGLLGMISCLLRGGASSTATPELDGYKDPTFPWLVRYDNPVSVSNVIWKLKLGN